MEQTDPLFSANFMIKHRYFKIGCVFLVIFVGLLTGITTYFLRTPLITSDQGIRYTVREGSSFKVVIDELHSRHVIKHPILFLLYIRLKNVSHELKAGEYYFSKGTTPPKMLHQLITGSGMIYHSFTIISGWNFSQVRQALAHEANLHHTIENLKDTEIMAQLDHADLHPEGQFYPDTYFFVEGSSDISLLQRAFKTMQEKLHVAWEHRQPNLPFKNSYEALIAASIIEKEYYLEEELPVIAGVMVNRLRKNMLLQFDPTVIYGAGDNFDGTIRRTHLLANNPYNTYIHKGLPPTPISMPSLDAIHATLHPEQHNYFYFVAKGNGAHQFSETLDQHNIAVTLARKDKSFFNFVLVQHYFLKAFAG